MAKTGRRTTYDDVEDAVILNTTGEPPDYTAELLTSLGYPERSADAITSRRSLLRNRPASANALERLKRVKVLAWAAHLETEHLKDELQRELTETMEGIPEPEHRAGATKSHKQ